MLATGSWDDTVKLWDVATGKERATLKGHDRNVWAVAFSADGKLLAAESEWGMLKLWDVSTGKEKATLKHTPNVMPCLAISGDSRRLVSGNKTGEIGGSVKVWDLPGPKEVDK
jgi:WD40 repeat protein